MIIHPTFTRHIYIQPNLVQCVEVEETENSEYPYSYTVWQTTAVHTFLAKRDFKNKLNKDLGLVENYIIHKFD